MTKLNKYTPLTEGKRKGNLKEQPQTDRTSVLPPPAPKSKKATGNKHEWVKDKEYKSVDFKERHVCTICNCVRLMFYLPDGSKAYIFARSGIILVAPFPSCINWKDTENLNRIDQ